MTDTVCGFTGDRDEALVTYLYDEGADPASRAIFEAHLARCRQCAEDLAALRGVRVHLARWAPPEPQFSVTSRAAAANANPQSPIPNPRSSWWRDVPVWAQVAAALLFLGVSVGVASLDVRYDANGLSVRTGWMKPGVVPAPVQIAPIGTDSRLTSAAAGAPWRADLAALERQLKTEFHGAQAAAPMSPAAATQHVADAEILRRVRALIDESERRQQSELALRLTEAIRDINEKRQADLIRVRGALGDVQNRLGVQMFKNSQQVQQMDYLIRTSQKQ